MLDRLYGSVARGRRQWFERHPERRVRLERPVISVGNLRVGGTGKTPLAGAIARWLVANGERPSILSRGYGRRWTRDGVTVVSDGTRVQVDVAAAGDEPLMLARQLTGVVVLVSADRGDAGRVAERVFGCTVHVLDDGFQHLRLERECDVLIGPAGDATRERLLPLGRLREPVTAARGAHVLVVVDASREEAEAEASALGIAHWCRARRVIGSPAASGLHQSVAGTNASEPMLAVAGIASPPQFFRALADAGWTIVRSLAFPDHHRFSPQDVGRIAREVAASRAAGVLTTEKDAMRFEACGPLPFSTLR